MDDGGGRPVEVRDSSGVIVGDGNTQINYTYTAPTTTGGVAPPPLVTVSGVVESPYRGLNSFEDGEEAFFFGRDAAVTNVLTRLTSKLSAPGLLMVSGASGVGKSSLLRAGVVPRLRAGSLAGGPGAGMQASGPWPSLVITPTRAPLDELASRVAPVLGVPATVIQREIAADPRGFALIARQAVAAAASAASGHGLPQSPSDPGERRLVLVVDQFEELFTQCPDGAEEERQAFITALHAAATTPTGSAGTPAALVVLGVRADLEGRCARYELLADAVQDRYMLMPMTERQLRLAITEPALVAGSRVEDGLVDALVREIAAQGEVLPLLSYALDQAWRNRTGDTLRLADYERVGGLEGSVAASAGGAYASLNETQQTAAEQVFIRLTTINSDGRVSAAQPTRAELEAGMEASDVTAVLEAFADKSVRLLTLGPDQVSISHEALLTAWDRLREWLDGDLDDRIRFTRLRADARIWDDNKRTASDLYSAGRLAELEAAQDRRTTLPGRYPPLDEVSAAFASASRRAVRAADRRRRGIVAIIVALALCVGTAAVVAILNAAAATRNAAAATRNAAIADQQHAIALSRQLAAESATVDAENTMTARRLAVAAWDVSPTSQASDAMMKLLVEQQDNGELPTSPMQLPTGQLPFTAGVPAVAYSPDGKLLVAATEDGTQLWDTASLTRVGGVLPAQVITSSDTVSMGVVAVAFSPDGRLVASGDASGNVQLWNTKTRRLVGQLSADPGVQEISGIGAVAFSPDGKYLVAAGGDGHEKVWTVARGFPLVRRLPVGYASFPGPNVVAFRPHSQVLAIVTSTGVQQWNIATGKEVGGVICAGNGANSVAYSPDGGMLACGTSDGPASRVSLWNLSTGRLVRIVSGSGEHANALAFSPSGQMLADADADGYLRLWNIGNGKLAHAPLPVAANTNSVQAVSFSPDGGVVATGDYSGTVKLWDISSYAPMGSPLRPNAKPKALVAALIGTRSNSLTGANSDGYVQLWDGPGDGGRVPPDVAAHGHVLTGQVISPDGKLIAYFTNNGWIQLRSTVTGQPVGKPLPANGNSAPYSGVAFSSDSKMLATADSSGSLWLWNAASGKPVGKPIHAATKGGFWVDDIAFNPDGKLLATADTDEVIRLWDVATGKPVGQPMVGDNLAFSPDGRLLASGGDDGYLRLYQTANQYPVAAVAAAPSLVTGSGGIYDLAFSPDGGLLASGDGDGYTRLWNGTNLAQVGSPLPAVNGNGISRVMFNSDGSVLVSVGYAAVQSWPVRIFADPYAALCADVGPPTAAEWVKYAPGEPEPDVCAAHKAA